MRLSLALVTDDLARLRTFYEELFRTRGFGDDTYVEFRTGLEVEVADVDSEYERLCPLASEIVTPPTNWPWGTRSTWLRDPDGNLISLFST
jgi:predicted enzyme related to lactoylglutathione lyase